MFSLSVHTSKDNRETTWGENHTQTAVLWLHTRRDSSTAIARSSDSSAATVAGVAGGELSSNESNSSLSSGGEEAMVR